MIYLLLFYKHIQCSSGSIWLCMFLSAVDALLGWSACSILCLSLRPFSRSVGEVDAPPVCFLPILARSVSARYCFVLQGLSRKLGYFLVLASQFCPIRTMSWGICSVIDDPFLSQDLRRFWRGFRSGQWIFPISPTQSGFSVLSDIFGYLCSWLRVFDLLTPHLAAFFLGNLAYPPFPWWQGLRTFWRDYFSLSRVIFSLPSLYHYVEGIDGLINHLKGSQFSCGFSEVIVSTATRLRATSREVCTYPSDFLVSWPRRCQSAVSLLSDGFFGLSIFPHVIWWGEDKIEVIQEIFSNVLRVFYHCLTLSRNEFAKRHTR